MASQDNNSSANNADISSGNGVNRTPAQGIDPSIFASRDGYGGTSCFGGFVLAPGVGNTPAAFPGSAPVAPTAAPPTAGFGSDFASGIRGRGNGRGRGNSGRGSYGGISRANEQPSVAVRPSLHSVPDPTPSPAATTSTDRSITFTFNNPQYFATRAQQFMNESPDLVYYVTFRTIPQRARARARRSRLESTVLYSAEQMARLDWPRSEATAQNDDSPESN